MGLGKKKEQKISTEELAKTQVLNLDDVQKLAKYEKLISKKPALVVALIGAFSIVVGVTAQTVVSLSKVNEPKAMPTVTNRATSQTKDKYDELICTQTTVDNNAELNIKMTYALKYKNDTLDTYTKTLDVTPTSTTSTKALTNVQNGNVAFKSFKKDSIDGYQLVVSNKESGYEVLVTVNPNKLDVNVLADEVKTNAFVKPDITSEMTKDQVQTFLSGYTCK